MAHSQSSAGASPHGRRKPNGSACQRRTMAGVQDEAKHAMSAMSLLKSCDVEKPQPQRSERMGPFTSYHQADNHTSGRRRCRLADFLLLGTCHGERTRVAHVIPGGRDPVVGALDVGDAELVDATVEGIGDAARVPGDAKGIRIQGQVSLRAVLCKSVSYAGICLSYSSVEVDTRQLCPDLARLAAENREILRRAPPAPGLGRCPLRQYPVAVRPFRDRQQRVRCEPLPPGALDRIGAVMIVHADRG